MQYVTNDHLTTTNYLHVHDEQPVLMASFMVLTLSSNYRNFVCIGIMIMHNGGNISSQS